MTLRYLLLPLLLPFFAAGCSTVPHDERDPLEGFNRAVYAFNDDFDKAILKPVAEGYERVVPQPIDNGITNFFSNLDDVLVVANDLLQFKFEQALLDSWRLTFNTTIGLLGIIDVASHIGLPKHNEDFGQTLGRWGVGTGPYLMLPFLGPSSIRDGVGLVADWQVDPVMQINDATERWEAIILDAVDTRAGLLRASRILDTAALDPYVFLRDAYLQRRQNLVYDGNPPRDEFEEFDPFADEMDGAPPQ